MLVCSKISPEEGLTDMNLKMVNGQGSILYWPFHIKSSYISLLGLPIFTTFIHPTSVRGGAEAQ